MMNIIILVIILFALYYIIKCAVKDGIKEAYHDLHMNVNEEKNYANYEHVNEEL